MVPAHLPVARSGGWPGRVQGWYYVASGLWPVVHYRSFTAITGPKADDWLVKTLGGLIAVVGAELIRRPGARWLGAGSALALGVAELVYVRRGRIRPVYLLDALAGTLFTSGWARRPDESAVLRVIERHLRDRAARDVELDARQNYAPDATIVDNGELRRGWDGVRRAAARLQADVPDADYSFGRLAIGDGYAMLDWTATSPQGVEAEGVDFFHIRDGRIRAQAIQYSVRPGVRTMESEVFMAGPDETRRRRGGEELPDEVQDRPEQNRGYDEAVRGEAQDTPGSAATGAEDELPDPDEPPPARSVDDEAARRAAADVRRREHRSR